jgi:hypothetical protein
MSPSWRFDRSSLPVRIDTYTTLRSDYPVSRHRIAEERNPRYDTVSVDETGYHMLTFVTGYMLSFVSQRRI